MLLVYDGGLPSEWSFPPSVPAAAVQRRRGAVGKEGATSGAQRRRRCACPLAGAAEDCTCNAGLFRGRAID